MATTVYLEEVVKDQNDNLTMTVEFGRSSFYSGSKLDDGSIGEDSIYLTVDGQTIIMDRKTAEKFVNAAASVGRYLGLLEE